MLYIGLLSCKHVIATCSAWQHQVFILVGQEAQTLLRLPVSASCQVSVFAECHAL